MPGRERQTRFLLPGISVFVALVIVGCGPEPDAGVAAQAPDDSASPAASPVASSVPTTAPTPIAPSRITLAAVGDIMLARSVGRAVLARGPEVVFAGVQPLLADAEITVGNLETTISDRGQPAAKGYTFRAPPAAVDSLVLAGVDVVSLANNHSLDFGPEALSDTRSLLGTAGILSVGAGEDSLDAARAAVIERRGLRIAFLAFVDTPAEGSYGQDSWAATSVSAGVAWATEDAVTLGVAAALKQADIVVVLLHAGTEGSSVPSVAQRTLAEAAIDAGALLVIGSHPHVLQPVEEYGRGLIVYSLGNFVFDGFDGDANDSAVFLATLGPEGVESWEIVPVLIVDGLPVLP